MPTNKPRITVTLEPDVYMALAEFCDLSGRSMSSFLAESASEAMPVLTKLIPAFKLARQIDSHSVATAQAAVSSVQMDLVSALERLNESLVSTAPRTSPAQAGECGAVEERLSPSINKGVEFLQNGVISPRESNIYDLFSESGKGGSNG